MERERDTMLTINLHGGMPIYEQLKRAITEGALLGVLEPDEQLPSVRTLSRQLGVNPNTVQKAYQALENEGVIYSLSGKGSFISPRLELLPEFRRAAEEKLEESLKEALLTGVGRERIMEIMRSCEQSFADKKIGDVGRETE